MRKVTEADLREIARLWPAHTAEEVGAATGFSGTTVAHWARRMGLERPPEYYAAQREAYASRMRAMVAASDKARRVATWKRTRRRDELRWLGGQEQLTGFSFSFLTRRAACAKKNLVNQRGYRCKPGDVLALVYDGGTRRTPREAMFTEKYGLRFEEAGHD